MQMLVHIGLVYFVEKPKLFISIALVLSMFLKTLKNSLGTKHWEQIFLEYKQVIQ